MTVEPARRRVEAAGVVRPVLRVLVDCEHCAAPLTEVRDRGGRPVRFDADPAGRAVRAPGGEWWAMKVGERWCVAQPRAGEVLPPFGVRYAEHRCGGVDAERVLRSGLGAAEPVPGGDPPEPAPVVADPTVVRRPAGRGQGLSGPECPERRFLEQGAGGVPRWRMCVRCGRITERVDGDGMAWCGGL